jgi:transcription elongation factor Elf1
MDTIPLDVNCYCCGDDFEVEVKEGHEPELDKYYEECAACTHDYNLCEACGKGLDSFYEKHDNWGEKGKAPIWTENYHTINTAEYSYGRWDSHVTCPRCGHVNIWDDASG